ncbi:hypothetical protein H0H92_005094 [Tricholoma furcatifolium]|nr:hypothetical protein H0H92_005094 [Tricholoma furcatifolium]
MVAGSPPSLREKVKSVSLIFACGTALFSDGYANNVIGTVNTLLTRIYGKEALSQHNYSTVVNSVGFAGTVVGMIIFGLSAASSGAHGSVSGLLSMLSAMRFFLGIGVGAEYPCGSVAASEQSEEAGISQNARHRWVGLATITTLIFGFVIASFTPWVLYLIFGPNHLRAVWRLSLGLGMVPAFAVILWRLNMDDPRRYKSDSMKNAHIPYTLVIKRYWRDLIAISIVWFILDIISYPFSIYSSTVLNNITGGSDDLKIVFGWNVVISLFALPGAAIGSLIVDSIGPKTTLISGLLLQALTGFLMSGLYVPLTRHIAAFSTVYGLFQSFSQFGAGLCTFIFASKTSATAVRGQYFGVASACGKLGAFVGIWIYPPIVKSFGGSTTVRGNTGPFWIASGIALEDREFRDYLEANGYDTSLMGILGSTSTDTSSEDEKTVPAENV